MSFQACLYQLLTLHYAYIRKYFYVQVGIITLVGIIIFLLFSLLSNIINIVLGITKVNDSFE